MPYTTAAEDIDGNRTYREREKNMERFEHGGNIYTGAKITSDFSININPLGMPEGVKEAIAAHTDSYDIYPDPHCTQLREELAAYLTAHIQTETADTAMSSFGSRKTAAGDNAGTKAVPDIAASTAARTVITPDMLLCGNGADDLIYRMCYALRPQHVLVTAPTFSEYEKAAMAAGAQVRYHYLKEENGFILTDAILDDITDDIDIVFVCTPNNPTGRTVDRELIRRIERKCRECDAYLLLDECFICFTDVPSCRDMLSECPNMVILDAFTKRYAAAGLRLGFMQSSKKHLLKCIYDAGPCWNVSTPAQVAGTAALRAQDYLPESVAHIERERTFLTERLRVLGITVYPSQANYLLIRTQVPLYDLLRGRGILIRACDNYIGLDGTYFRICVKHRDEELALLEAIEEVMHG